MEQNLKANYNQIDLEKINSNLNYALINAQLDSLQHNYSQVLAEISRTNSSKTKPCDMAIPDASIEQVQKAKIEVQLKLNQLKKLRIKKIVSL
jgi:hypothetical protein